MTRILVLSGLLASFTVLSQNEYFIRSADGNQLRVREYGSGEAVIILAGGPGLNADYMRGVWEGLKKQYRCIVLDQRGTGRSVVSKVDSASMSMSRYIEDLEALRQHLQLDKLTLIGHSWGAMLCMEYAAQRPKHTGKLILVGAGGPTGKFYAYFGDNLRMRLHESDRKELASLESLGKSGLRALWPGYFYDREIAMQTKAMTDFDSIMGQPDVSSYTVRSYVEGSDDRMRRLKQYHGPVILIQGRQDPIGESTAYEIRDVLPQTNLIFIEKCGHVPWLEKVEVQEEFFRLLTKALK